MLNQLRQVDHHLPAQAMGFQSFRAYQKDAYVSVWVVDLGRTRFAHVYSAYGVKGSTLTLDISFVYLEILMQAVILNFQIVLEGVLEARGSSGIPAKK
jgi:hypothetical protein